MSDDLRQLFRLPVHLYFALKAVEAVTPACAIVIKNLSFKQFPPFNLVSFCPRGVAQFSLAVLVSVRDVREAGVVFNVLLCGLGLLIAFGLGAVWSSKVWLCERCLAKQKHFVKFYKCHTHPHTHTF